VTTTTSLAEALFSLLVGPDAAALPSGAVWAIATLPSTPCSMNAVAVGANQRDAEDTRTAIFPSKTPMCFGATVVV
jgi:hypothetical protein